MLRFLCLALFVAFLAAAVVALPAQTPGAQTPTNGSSQQPNSDYGAGGHAVMQNDMAGAMLQGTVYDSNNTERHDETNTYTTTGGTERKTEQHAHDFDSGGHLRLDWDFKYDLRGGLTYSDVTHFGLHGERTAEEITTYNPTGYEIKDWSIGTHNWYTNSITYKTPLPTGSAAQAPLTPTVDHLGVLFPRDYVPGETVTGSLWPSTYAEGFKVVPGLSEFSFPVQLYHLPDGSPEWSSLQIGVKGDGYAPVNPNGTFSLHIPYDWKGPLELQVRQPDPVGGLGFTSSLLNLDSPVAAPTLSNDYFPLSARLRLKEDTEDYLVSLWGDACDDEEILDNLYAEAIPDWARIFAVEDELDDIYDEIDYVEDGLPPSEVISLAQNMYQEATSYHNWLSSQPNLTADDQYDLADSSSWAAFLSDEIGYNKFLAAWGSANPVIQPYWTNPVITQGKLNVINGLFPLDPCDTHLHIDNFGITPLAATPYSWYFMPDPGLTSGLHYEYVDSPLFPRTVFPEFEMTLFMWADQLNLHKGQHTTYHLTLSGLNGLPGGAWNGSSDPTDIVGSSELGQAQKAAGSSRQGYITLSITNQSPGVISMQDQFKTLSASYFAPSGSYSTDGGVGAIADGGFSILGVARAYLEPEIGVGIPPGTSVPGSSAMSGWLPSFSVNFDPAAFSNSSFMTSCPGSSAAPAGGKPSSPCVESVINDLYPPHVNPPTSVPVGDNDNADLTKLPEVIQRQKDALKKRQDAIQKSITTGKNLDTAWENGVKSAPKELVDEWKKAMDKLHQAYKAEGEMAVNNNKEPTEQNAALLAAAKEDVAAWEKITKEAHQKIVDSFKPDDRKAYDAASAAYTQAWKDVVAAIEEERAATEELEKLQKAMGVK